MMKQLLPHRHKSKIMEKLELLPFPGDVTWNGSIIYLDRDGVINIGSEDYINSPEELIILPGVADSLVKLKLAGFRLCLVTNQSPINRGLWGHEILEKIHDKLIAELLNDDKNAFLDLILYSPYAPMENSIARKPEPGMLRSGNIIINSAELNIKIPLESSSLSPSILFSEGGMSAMVGDRYVDYLAGKSHGVRTFIVNPAIGLPQVISRILDKNDKGDVMQ